MYYYSMNPIIKWGDDESRTPGIDENACDSMNAAARAISKFAHIS